MIGVGKLERSIHIRKVAVRSDNKTTLLHDSSRAVNNNNAWLLHTM